MPEYKQLYLICGDEQYRKKNKLNELLAHFAADNDLNYNSFTGEDLDLEEAARLCDTLPFMAEHRVVLLRDTGFCKGNAGAELAEIAEGMAESTILILYEEGADASNRLYKLIAKRGEVCRFDQAEAKGKNWKEAQADKSNVKSWAKSYLKEAGRKIDSRTLEELLNLTGYDMLNLETELEKLICYTMGRDGQEITKADIEAICSKTVTDKVFDMVAAKLAGNAARALLLFEEMLSIKVPPMRVLYLLARQFNQVYLLKELQGERLSDAQIAAKLGVKDWQLRKLKEQAVRIGTKEARRYLEACVALETKTKQGDVGERLAVEMLLSM